MSDLTKPGSWVGDSIEEFKKLPTWGKFAIAGIFIAVAAFGFYEYRKSKSGTVGSALGQSGLSPSTDMTGGAAGIQSPFPLTPGQNGSQIPILPFGYTPIFDGQGNLIGWEPPGTPPNPPPNFGGPPTPKPKPKPKPKPGGEKEDHDTHDRDKRPQKVPPPPVHKGPQHRPMPPQPTVARR